MKQFEIADDGKTLRLTASTRPGLLTAAMQGMFAAAGTHADEAADAEVTREFALSAPDASALLSALLVAGLAESSKRGECYDDLRFTLITDKKAEGAFVGKACKKPGKKIAGIASVAPIAKNDLGEWETSVTLS